MPVSTAMSTGGQTPPPQQAQTQQAQPQQGMSQSQLQNIINQTMNTQLQKVPTFGQSGEQASAYDQAVYNSLIQQGINPLQAGAVQNYLNTNQFGGSSGVIGRGGGAQSQMAQWLQNNATQWAPGAAAAAMAAGPANNAGQPGSAQTPAQQQAQAAIQPTYMGAPPTAIASQSAAAVDPSTTLSMILQGFAPQAASAQSGLQNQLAAMGIQGGGAADAETALQRNLAAGIAPTLGSAVQSAQGMTLEQSLANAQSQNQMTALNVGDWMQQQMANMGASNTAGAQLANYLMQGWESPLQQFGGINQQGLGTSGQMAVNQQQNFPVYQQSPIWGMLGTAAGGALGGPLGASLGGSLAGMLSGGSGGTTYTPGVGQSVPGGNVSGQPWTVDYGNVG